LFGFWIIVLFIIEIIFPLPIPYLLSIYSKFQIILPPPPLYGVVPH